MELPGCFSQRKTYGWPINTTGLENSALLVRIRHHKIVIGRMVEVKESSNVECWASRILAQPYGHY